MQRPQIPVDEAKRLAALYATELYGTAPEEAFDRITRLAARLFDVPTVLISLVGSDTQWFKSRCGMDAQSGPRETSFCGHAILSDQPLVVEDATLDERFADNPSVIGAPHIRFYAGVQLYSVERAKLGTLCVIDSRPRTMDEDELEELYELGRMVEELIYHRQLARAAQELHEQLLHNAAVSPVPAAAGQVKYLLTHDALTGLANRQALLRSIGANIAAWQAAGASAVVACLNLDRFKQLNEVLGHEVGDAALVTVTRALQAHLREGDMLARAGNDEFVMLLNDPDGEERLLARLGQLMAEVNSHAYGAAADLSLTCSVGFACYPKDGEEGDTLLNNAVTAMRHAKAQGGGRIERYDPAQRREMGRRLTLESHLRRALEREELFLQYQPKIALDSGKLAGFEVLLRWRHPEHGVVSPEEFVPIAEETGLIAPIGEWIVKTAVGQLAAWREAGVPAVPVAVNLSARQFMQSDIVAIVSEQLAAAELPPALLELELTESVSMADPGRSMVVMHKLKSLGVALSIDDFGTGYSSFSYLRRLPIDKLKIDKSFVQDVAHSADSRTIVQAIAAMAHRLNLGVVAEGVETAAQAAALREAGCDQAQGFLYARPLSPGDAAAFIVAHGSQAQAPPLRSAARRH
ncbi:sensor domain-containing phosphodiesterase [Massilia sp. YIM B02769]|uniref:putative bifunctional diguanylate cyclase/phosphodiesterase n=1 Tax=unclassified Massilia TaxID=2609279 RepID=UPI0025B72E39|nr:MULTISPECIES: sensor domain-containing phosphodiesterase [unclassified Massilia]MDN4057318.1 sensor domain-containing phosphodiesterase [Massilia sp. YIM B02769]